jgi:hypothetical protein
MAELATYMDGRVAEDIRLQIEAHLSHCQTCQVVLDSTRKTLTVVTESGSFELPDDVFTAVTANVMAKIRSQH